MNTVIKIFLIILVIFTNFTDITYAAWDINSIDQVNLKTWAKSWENSTVKKNNHLKALQDSETDFTVDVWGKKWIYFTLIRIARDLKNVFFILAGLFFIIIVLKLLFSEKTEEEVWNFKKWIIWISIWIIITQIAFYFINILFDKDITVGLADNFIDIIIYPFITLLETITGFAFIAMMIYSFFRMVTANWDEEAIKAWKMSILYALIWFVVVRITKGLVTAIYWKTNCWSLFQINCTNQANLEWIPNIIVKIINWANGFVWVFVIIMIIYAWFLTLTSGWDEDKLKKSKSIILYIIIWIFILFSNYLILTFFIFPETQI